MNDRQYQLFVNRGPEPGKVFELTSVSMTIGRDPMAEITINDPEVSRRHARLIGTLSGYRIQDLGSTNGTFIDGIRVGGDPIDLTSGQVISIGGGVVLVFQVMAEDDDAQSVTMLDTALVLPDLPEQEDSLDVVAGEPEEQMEPEKELESESAVDEIESAQIDSFVEEELEQPPAAESPPPISNWESPSQEDAPVPSQDEAESYEADSYEAKDFSEPVVIPHKGEPDQSIPASESSKTRRLSTIIAAVMFLVICCCCSFLLFMYYYAGDLLLRQMGLLP
jgi:pSer/pThr/pTyr-binding forkhead associated (FHA) protein